MATNFNVFYDDNRSLNDLGTKNNKLFELELSKVVEEDVSQRTSFRDSSSP